MSKRSLWVVEWKDGKGWVPVDFESHRTRAKDAAEMAAPKQYIARLEVELETEDV